MLVASAAVVHSSAVLEDDKVGLYPFRYCDDAESASAGSISGLSNHLVDAVFLGVDLARETIAAISFAGDLDAPGRHVVAERSCRLEVHRVPGQFDKGVSVRIGVSASDVWGPVANRIVFGAPDTGLVSANTGRVDVIARRMTC